MTEKEHLTFEEFIEGDPTPRWDSFDHYFRTGTTPSSLARDTQHFQKFQREHPDLERRLREEIEIINPSANKAETLKPFEKDMYEAYLIMRGYGASDEDLLIASAE